MSSPLIDRLTVEFGFPLLDADGLEIFVREADIGIVFLTDDPATNRQTNDVAVVLPELVTTFGGRVRAAVAERSIEGEIAARFGVTALPALVMVRDGGYAGIIARFCDWSVYLERIQELIEGPTQPLQNRRPPQGSKIKGPAAFASKTSARGVRP